jgi:hypothetical protein
MCTDPVVRIYTANAFSVPPSPTQPYYYFDLYVSLLCIALWLEISLDQTSQERIV